MRVATFNCEWRKPSSRDGRIIAERLVALSPEVVCLSEAFEDTLPMSGHVLASRDATAEPERRTIVLWSAQPLRRLNGTDWLEEFGFVAAETETSLGPLTVVGVCIPYRFSGRYESPPAPLWSHHARYLDELAEWLAVAPQRTVLLGDFNQRIPPKFQARAMYQRLKAGILDRLPAATAGLVGPSGRLAIDHIACSPDLAAIEPAVISNLRSDGGEISDHFGLTCRLLNAARTVDEAREIAHRFTATTPAASVDAFLANRGADSGR